MDVRSGCEFIQIILAVTCVCKLCQNILVVNLSVNLCTQSGDISLTDSFKHTD